MRNRRWLYCKKKNFLAGAVFDDGDFVFEAAFNVAVSEVSKDEEKPFVVNVVKTAPGDILEAENAVCNLLEVI